MSADWRTTWYIFITYLFGNFLSTSSSSVIKLAGCLKSPATIIHTWVVPNRLYDQRCLLGCSPLDHSHYMWRGSLGLIQPSLFFSFSLLRTKKKLLGQTKTDGTNNKLIIIIIYILRVLINTYRTAPNRLLFLCALR